jgi:hypothetical protein
MSAWNAYVNTEVVSVEVRDTCATLWRWRTGLPLDLAPLGTIRSRHGLNADSCVRWRSRR